MGVGDEKVFGGLKVGQGSLDQGFVEGVVNSVMVAVPAERIEQDEQEHEQAYHSHRQGVGCHE